MGESDRQTILKGLYEELGRNFRHFLAWRRFLFAGYFAVIAGLAAAFKLVEKGISNSNAFLLLVAALLSTLFWLLDRRNRKLIRNASDAGENLEKEMYLGNSGYYSIYKHQKHLMTHSIILGWFYGLSILGYVAWFMAIVFF